MTLVTGLTSKLSKFRTGCGLFGCLVLQWRRDFSALFGFARTGFGALLIARCRWRVEEEVVVWFVARSGSSTVFVVCLRDRWMFEPVRVFVRGGETRGGVFVVCVRDGSRSKLSRVWRIDLHCSRSSGGRSDAVHTDQRVWGEF